MERDFSADMNEALPSIATLESYVNGELSGSEAERLESRIAEDPMLADVVEGLKMTRADSGHEARMSRLQHRVSAAVEAMPAAESVSSRRQSRVKPFPQYLVYSAIAAGFAILLVFVGLMKDQEQSESAPVTDQITSADPAPAPQAEPLPEETILPEEAEGDEPLIAEATPPPPPPPLSSAPTSPSRRSTYNNTTPPVVEEVVDELDVAEEPTAFLNEPVASPASAAPTVGESLFDDMASVPVTDSAMSIDSQADPLVVTAPAYGNSTDRDDEADFEELRQQATREESEVIRERTSELQAEVETYTQAAPRRPVPEVDFTSEDIPRQSEEDRLEGSLSKAQLMADLLQMAIDAYERDQPDSAITFLDEVLLSEPGNVTASYYKGLSLMEQEKYKEAVTLFETATEIEESQVFVEAEFQLARALMLAGKNRRARNLLGRIVEQEGKYAGEAAALLENMD